MSRRRADPPHSAGTGGRNEHRRARGRRWHAGRRVQEIFPAFLVIPAVTLLCCLASVEAGRQIGGWFGRRAELCGGIILVLIGIRQVL